MDQHGSCGVPIVRVGLTGTLKPPSRRRPNQISACPSATQGGPRGSGGLSEATAGGLLAQLGESKLRHIQVDIHDSTSRGVCFRLHDTAETDM